MTYFQYVFTCFFVLLGVFFQVINGEKQSLNLCSRLKTCCELDKNTFQTPSTISTCARVIKHVRMDGAFSGSRTYSHPVTLCLLQLVFHPAQNLCMRKISNLKNTIKGTSVTSIPWDAEKEGANDCWHRGIFTPTAMAIRDHQSTVTM